MEKKLTTENIGNKKGCNARNEDYIAEEIEKRINLISSGELPCQTAIKVLDEIKNLTLQLRSSSRNVYMTYVNRLEERVLNFYARNEAGKNL